MQMRFLVLLSLFDVVDTESLSQSLFSLLDMIKLTHSAILIRVFTSTMLYVLSLPTSSQDLPFHPGSWKTIVDR